MKSYVAPVVIIYSKNWSRLFHVIGSRLNRSGRSIGSLLVIFGCPIEI
jgi:hypothetical protein